MEEDSKLQSSAQRFRKLISQRMVVGTFSKSQDPAFIEIIGRTGFDFVVLDLEHGPNTVLSLPNLIRAAEVAGLVPIVRVKEDTPSLISEVLDSGAAGIQVPQISTRNQAEEVLQAARFNPLGMRGVCRFVRAADYSSLDKYEYFARANTSVIVMQLEGVGAVKNIQEILSVPGLDIAFIVVGTFVDTIEEARKWSAAGVKYLCYSVDVGLFAEKCCETIQTLRASIIEENKP